MPTIGVAPHRLQEQEPLVEPARDLGDVERAGAGRGELDRQRDAVEPAADLHDGRRRGIRQLEVRIHGTGALHEQRNGRRRGEVAPIEGVERVDGERLDTPDVLAGDRQRLAAGGEDMDVRRMAQDAVDECRDRFDEVLAVVEHDQGGSRREHLHDRVVDRRVLSRADLQRGRERQSPPRPRPRR